MTTAVDATGLATKRVVYVGGLAEEASITVVRASMIPFGNIKSVDIVRSAFLCDLDIEPTS